MGVHVLAIERAELPGTYTVWIAMNGVVAAFAHRVELCRWARSSSRSFLAPMR